MLKTRIPFYFVIIASLLGGAAVSIYLYNSSEDDYADAPAAAPAMVAAVSAPGSSSKTPASAATLPSSASDPASNPSAGDAATGSSPSSASPAATAQPGVATTPSSTKSQMQAQSSSVGSNNPGDKYKINRQNGYNLIRPLLLVRPANESKELAPLKAKLTELLVDDIKSGTLITGSVHLMSFTKGEWTAVNPSGPFEMGTMVNVPLLITYLYEAETNPQVMNKKIYFEEKDRVSQQAYGVQGIQSEHFYSVKDLLKSMIAGSDKNATRLLYDNVNEKLFKKTFSLLDMPEPNLKEKNYKINAKTFSRFLTVLYDATYLSRSGSENALKMLSQCGFKDGIMKGLPQSVKAAHKFGEWEDTKHNTHGLHETAIVYLNDGPYLLTIMTNGTDPKVQAEEISKISKLVYDTFAANPNP